MPDDDIPSKFQKWIEEKAPDSVCPICGSGEWFSPGDIRAFPRHQTTYEFSGATYPVVVVTCTNCGYAMPFNSVVMGISPPYPTQNVQDALGQDQ